MFIDPKKKKKKRRSPKGEKSPKGYKLKKQVRKSKAYLIDKKLRGKKHQRLAGFRFHRTTEEVVKKQSVKESAQKSADTGAVAKNQKQLQKGIDKLKDPKTKTVRKVGYGTLGHPVVKKKRRN